MAKYSTEKILKNIDEEIARIMLETLDANLIKMKIWVKEYPSFNPNDHIPDMELELNFKNKTIILQTNKEDLNLSQKALICAAVGGNNQESHEEMTMIVLSNTKKSKRVKSFFESGRILKSQTINLKEFNPESIINNIKENIEKNNPLTTTDMMLYALIAIIKGYDPFTNNLLINTKIITN